MNFYMSVATFVDVHVRDFLLLSVVWSYPRVGTPLILSLPNSLTSDSTHCQIPMRKTHISYWATKFASGNLTLAAYGSERMQTCIPLQDGSDIWCCLDELKS
jgi:hypothetical protein